MEQKAIEAVKEAYPGQNEKNGLRAKPRQMRTAYGLFGYRLARVFDKETGESFTTLSEITGLAAYHRQMEDSGEGGIGFVCHFYPT